MLPLSKLETSIEFSDEGTQWTGLHYGELFLSNSIENADWKSDPVSPWACWGCEEAWCARICLSRVVRTESQLLFMKPYYKTPLCEPDTDDDSHKLLEDSLLIPFDDWQRVRNIVHELPDVKSFPVITNQDIINLWLQQRQEYAIENEHYTFTQNLRKNCIASHPFSVDQFTSILEEQLDLLNFPPVEVEGIFDCVTQLFNSEDYNSLYFDLEGLPEFVTHRVTDHALVIGNEYLFNPASPTP
ncbi:MAG TPA: hypothetical protein DD473_18090 [Planctomycetaceae bacterium]|nr:hypothetical protein [Planctomycetaceae bacterium]